MKYITTIIIIINLLYGQYIFSQCSEAAPICSSAVFEFKNTYEGGPDGTMFAENLTNIYEEDGITEAPNGGYASLRLTRYPTWLYFKIGGGGDLDLKIEQNSEFGNSGARLDVDFVCWGPYESL
ncbi:MAG: hypothetical protein HRT66_06940, partial [Flavobacteriaceae bacterium]|nr:hypothetical protein [Flavobacteriaceae bacterium]